MVDFLKISTRTKKRGTIEIYPKFIIKKSSDLMIRGGDFYAVWVEERGLWSTDEDDVTQIIDRELDRFAEEHKGSFTDDIHVMHMWDADSGVIDAWHKYCQKQMRDNFHILDEKLIFSNTETRKEDYASKRLSYPLETGDISAYDELMSVLYSPEERQKIEWAIGSIVSGDSRDLQKFLVLYGAAGTGKSTVLNIVQQLFDGYYSVFDAKALGSSTNLFALEAFRNNPLVAIQHDGDLSKIEDNTRLNSVVSHERMTMNEKYKSTYESRFRCFLFMGTNKPVKITDAKSGLIRRLIDVSPTGNKLSAKDYKRVTKHLSFELGAIAQHCLEVYLENPGRYDSYIPVGMMGASNDFYNFMLDSYYIFKKDDGTSLKSAWEMYKLYCSEANVSYPFSQRIFKEELKNYFEDYKDRYQLTDGSRPRQYYHGFKSDIFEEIPEKPEEEHKGWIIFKAQPSLLDSMLQDCPAQEAGAEDKPVKPWDKVSLTLKEIDTSKVHYVRVPVNHIVIDFDIPDEDGNKSLEKNLEAANKWPRTYAELSKSGKGIHLHYIYTGDVSKLSREYSDHIEVKIFTGKSSLRRKLTECNDIPVMTISSGLPLKGEKKIVNLDTVMNEKQLRSFIKKCINKEHHGATKPEVDFIFSKLEEKYQSGEPYDVSDMRNAIFSFAASSSHQGDYCMKLVSKMKFKSDDQSPPSEEPTTPLIFVDVEVFPNLLLINWKFQGKGKPIVRMINPKPEEVEELTHYNIVAFNNRRYDNHILYAKAFLKYTNEQLFELSQKIVDKKSKNAFFGEAYNLSYTDIYDFCSKKQSLKKWEIELGLHHKELGLPWDQPVPEELWEKVAEYCDNDVIAAEAVFYARQADFTARKILADVAGMTVNDTTNSLTTRIIFGNDKKPQSQFNYRNMGDTNQPLLSIDLEGQVFDEYTSFTPDGNPVFPGYIYEKGVSTYRGEEIGEGGYVYAEPGMYGNVALLDIASMHPSSIIAEDLFGPKYTKRFAEIRDARIAIKHGDYEKARTMLDGKLAGYLDDKDAAADLAQALKIAINSVYGLTAASFDNPFRDIRNKDNIVAKRGALFMVNLKHEVQRRGFTVAHIKTDSIKIPDATPEIIQFVMDYGKLYGYNFEHEATYDRMCLVNDAVYIAKYKDGKHAGEWTATGAQFQVPYIFKKLFTKEEIVFDDLCETKSCTTALYLDMNENLPADEHNYRFVGKVGQFSPVKAGCGGGELMAERRDKDGQVKYNSVGGTKGYRWLESEMVRVLERQDDIDISYYQTLADKAVEEISKYGDFYWFVSDEPYIGPVFDNTGRPVYDEDLPF